LLSTSYKIVTSILLSRLSPHVDEIIMDHQCGFRRNRTTTDQFLHSSNTEKKIYIETVHQIFTDFKKAYDSVRTEVFYNIVIVFVVPMKPLGLIKMCLN
jgi:hypothetical protein